MGMDFDYDFVVKIFDYDSVAKYYDYNNVVIIRSEDECR